MSLHDCVELMRVLNYIDSDQPVFSFDLLKLKIILNIESLSGLWTI